MTLNHLIAELTLLARRNPDAGEKQVFTANLGEPSKVLYIEPGQYEIYIHTEADDNADFPK
jgi:hypothetical protein